MKVKIRLRYDPEFTQLRDAVTEYADEQLKQAEVALHNYDSPVGLLRHVADLYELRDTIASDLAEQEKKGMTAAVNAIGTTTVDPKLLLEIIRKDNTEPHPGWDNVLYQVLKALTTEGR